MFRHLGKLLVSLWQAVRHALSECWELLCAPFQNMRPGQWRSKLASDRADLGASSQMILLETSRTASGVARVIARSPVTAARWLAIAPGRFWFFLRTRTKKQLALLCVIAVMFVVAVVGPYWIIRRSRYQEFVWRNTSQQLENAFVHCDFDGVKRNLEALLKVKPDDPVFKERLAALEKGSADSQDRKMARLLMVSHRAQGRWDDAKREAMKYIVFAPKDWTALAILAERAMVAGDRVQTVQWVSQMPPSFEAGETISMWTCSIASGVFQDIGDEPRLDDLSEYVGKTWVPYLPKPIVAESGLLSKLQLIEMYELSLRQVAQHPDLLEYWIAAQDLTDNILAPAQVPTVALIRLGVLLETQRDVHLRNIEQLNLFSLTKSADAAKQLETRLNTIWSRVRAAEPKNPFGYTGPAAQSRRAGDNPGALAFIDKGILAAGLTPDLIERKAEILRQTNPAEALKFLDSVLGGGPKTPNECRILAQAAIAAGQTERAFAAVQRGQELLPGAPWLTVLEAEADLQAGRPTDATIALRKVLHLIPRDPQASRLYVRAQCACGAVVLAEQFLNELMDQHEGSTAAILMGCAALRDAGQIGTAINVLRRLTHREPLNLAATVALAECLYIQAEFRPNGWTRDELSEALAAYRTALRKYPDQLGFVNRIAWLELTALDAPKKAYVTSAPLRAAKDLTPDSQRTVGAICAYVGEYENARKYLETSLERSGPQASTLALLALTQHGLNKPAEAKETMEKAKAVENPTPREAELRDSIEKRIQRGSRP